MNFDTQLVNKAENSLPLLSQIARAAMEDRATMDELLECAEQTLLEARAQRDQMRSALSREELPLLDMVQAEVAAAEAGFEDFLALAEAASEAESLRRLAEGLPAAAIRLQLDLGRLDEALWIARGPTSLAGLNRLLGLTLARQPVNEYLILEREAWQKPNLVASHPAPLRGLVADFASEYLAWLQDFGVEKWLEQGRELGRYFARIDMAYLWRRHSGGPTPYGLLNVVVNAAWLRSGDHIDPLLFAYSLEMLSEEILRLESEFAATHLDAEQQDARSDLLSLGQDLLELLTHLRAWNERADQATLAKLRPLAIELGSELHGLLQAFPQETKVD